MHPAQIKAALAVAGYKQVDLARELSLEPGTISAVISGRSRSAQVEERIAAITGYALAELWPAWHGDAKPLALTSEERALILRYRELAPWQREQVLPMLQALLGGAQSQGSVVIAKGRSSRAAGRDYVEGGKPKAPRSRR